MEPTETAAYLRHLGFVGRADALFSDDAVAKIGVSGMPRAVNNLALQSLVATFAVEGDQAARSRSVLGSKVAVRTRRHRPGTARAPRRTACDGARVTDVTVQVEGLLDPPRHAR